MREIYVADSETDPFKFERVPKPFIWGLYNGDNFEIFYSTDEFIEYVSQREIIIYAHNGGKFDWFFILEHLDEFTEITVINGRLAKFKIGVAEFRDSLNILPVPLSRYKKDEIDYSIFEEDERSKQHNKKKIEQYLYGDCLYLYEFVTAYIEEMGLNLTLASGAMKFWSKQIQESPPTTNKNFYETFSPYYYGGRVQCFKTGIINHPFKVIDINSAYPYAMTFRHPYGNIVDLGDSIPEDREQLQRSFIRLNTSSLGVFPYREGDTLTFPSDGEKRIFTITGWEYIAAKQTGYLDDHDIVECITLYDSIDFSEYVEHWFGKKSIAKVAKDIAAYWIAKFHLNALYGKFGANPEKYDEYTNIQPSQIMAAEEVDDWGYCGSYAGWAIVSRPLPEEKQHYYNVAVSASITGFVRAYLWRAIHACSGILYCDTDSIAASDFGNLNLSEELGAWDVEAECSFGAIAGKKLYAFKTSNGWKTATKGVKLTHKDIIEVAKGKTVNYKSEAPTFSLKRGVSFLSRNVVMTG